MADPEQIYAEVLSEEQGKGVSAPVAEGRAKAARARAEAGSPSPKEAKWWPGAQPHLEGGDEAPAEPETAETEEAEAEAPAEPEPAAAPAAEETPAETEQEAAEPAAEEAAQPAAEAPAAPAPAASAPAQPAAAAVEAPPEAKPSGVIHGSPSGTRLRPEDSSTTEAQFEGQAAMYERRKLIDELVATGVPVVSATDTGGSRSPALALLYLLIPIMAIAFLLAQNDSAPAEAGGEEHGGGGGAITLTAASVQFDTDQLTLPADTEATVHFVNDDSVPHNFSIYEDDSASKELFIGQEIAGDAETDYSIEALAAGEYFFRCDLHPSSMTGTATVE